MYKNLEETKFTSTSASRRGKGESTPSEAIQPNKKPKVVSSQASTSEMSKSVSNSVSGTAFEKTVEARLENCGERIKVIKKDKGYMDYPDVLNEVKNYDNQTILCFVQVQKGNSRPDFVIARGTKTRDIPVNPTILLIDAKTRDESHPTNDSKALNKRMRANDAKDRHGLRKAMIEFNCNKGLLLYPTERIAETCSPKSEELINSQFYGASYLDKLLKPENAYNNLGELLKEEPVDISNYCVNQNIRRWKPLADIKKIGDSNWFMVNSFLQKFEEINKKSKSAQDKAYTSKLCGSIKNCLIQSLEEIGSTGITQDLKTLIEACQEEFPQEEGDDEES